MQEPYVCHQLGLTLYRILRNKKTRKDKIVGQPLLQVRALTTTFQIGSDKLKVVDNLNFTLEEGKTLAIVGESGCGKSMSALSIMRILPTPPALPSSGEVLYRGVNLLTLPESQMRKMRGGQLAMIFQDPISSLNPVYTIGYQLMETAELHLGLIGEEAREKAALSLKEVGIASPAEVLDDYPHQLSGGMKQRVMIAMALMCEPDILIADEPTTALDVTIQAQVLDLMRTLQKKRGMAILLITHDMGVVAEMADEVIVMYASQGVEKGSVYSTFDRMAHPYTAGLFASRPLLTSHGQPLQGIPGYVPSLGHYPRGCRFHPRCPYAMPKCKDGAVPEFKIQDDPDHLAACWLHDGSEESARMNRQGLGHERTFA
jgi:oligopeptide/dipeptide ABC transporter ATP-binding protein